jgi:hypothetical protein
MKKILRFKAVFGLMALAPGCSSKRVAVSKLGKALASGESTSEGDEDPELVAAAADLDFPAGDPIQVMAGVMT